MDPLASLCEEPNVVTETEPTQEENASPQESREKYLLKRCAEAIKDDAIRVQVIGMIETLLPDYFWHVPASSSGKYHPAYALGEGGLARHTLAACLMWRFVSESMNLSVREKDLTLAAIILHDGFKCGDMDYEGKTKFEHPLLMKEAMCFIGGYDMRVIGKLVACHMGKWNTSVYSDIKLPVPKNKLEKIVHTCDYLASRKSIQLSFENFEEMWDRAC